MKLNQHPGPNQQNNGRWKLCMRLTDWSFPHFKIALFLRDMNRRHKDEEKRNN